MWLQFLLALLICFIFVCLPGYILARACGYDRFFCFAIAPLMTTSIYTVLGIVYAKLGVYASWVSVMLPSTIFAILAFITMQYLRLNQKKFVAASRHITHQTSSLGFVDELKIFVPIL